MMRDCVASKLSLPDLNGIQINYISDADADLEEFLSKCTPAHLQEFWVNLLSNSWIGIKSKFYIDAFSEAARRTVKKVCFGNIDFSAKDLQTVVRAAHNTEQIEFYSCCIHCSSGLDFGADLNYKTKVISFESWGNTDYKERTTDWKKDPSKFSLIVDAISGCGLKDSLQELLICDNQTLTASKVQTELDEKGMSNISVVEKCN